MSNDLIDEEAVEKLFTTNGKDVWRCVSFCGEPSATFVNLETGARLGGSIYSPNVRQFHPLVMASVKVSK